jgi:hypothetical protein
MKRSSYQETARDISSDYTVYAGQLRAVPALALNWPSRVRQKSCVHARATISAFPYTSIYFHAKMNFPGTGGSGAMPLGVGGGMAGGMSAQQIQEAQMVKLVWHSLFYVRIGMEHWY